MATERSFPQVVSLACHDLRTPLATVHGFARTIERLEPADERTARYIGLIVDGSEQIVDLLERLALIARIERGAYEPVLRRIDSLELARSAALSVDAGDVAVSGSGADVDIDREQAEPSLRAFLTCAIRHGDSNAVACTVNGTELAISPVTAESGPILLGEDLRDFGAAAARMHVEALGGTVAVDGDALRIGLPATSTGGTAGGP